MNELNEYQHTTADWRAVLKKNKRRSNIVIGAFILIYLSVGFLFDLYLSSNIYPDASLQDLSKALITFSITPVATLITSTIALFSLSITFMFHDRLMLLGTEYQEITSTYAGDLKTQQLYHVIEEMKVAAGLHYMPKVYIIQADYMNAFASGYSEKSAMVAITRGLLEKLDREELTAVMAHELSHIRHLDIKLTLMASVLANLLVMLLDVLFYSVLFSGGSRRNSDREGNGQYLFILIMILRYVLPLITIFLMFFLSRSREYMADAGCVELMRNNEPLARALLKIQGDHETHREEYNAAYQQTPHEATRRQAYIFDPIQAGIEAKNALSDAFSTHPGIEKRLKALGFTSKNT